jgi:peptidoglycan/LPS O-acetylase OafA/YrhL
MNTLMNSTPDSSPHVSPSPHNSPLQHPSHAHFHNHLPVWQKRWLDTAMVALMLSGIVWLLVHYTVGAGTAAMLPHPAEFWLIRLHGLAGFLALFMLGVISAMHVPRGWRRGLRRPSALTVLGAWAISILTAYVLYYFAGESSHALIGWTHASVALVLWLAIFVHRRKARPQV